MIKISIIVPVYNTSKYLNKCLDSLCNQSIKKDYEIIVVNDGSTDNSESIILEYKSKYPKLIKYEKKQNGGVSSARNYGLKKANGEYILFVDSDDYVESNLLDVFFNKNKNYDLFVYGYNLVFENGKCGGSQKLEKEMVLSPNDSLELIMESSAVRGYPWNKIFKKSIIDKNAFLFDERVSYIEDLQFLVKYLYYCNNIYFYDATLYNYVQREGSLINSSFNKNKLTALDAYNEIARIVKENKPSYMATINYYIFELSYELSVRIRVSKEKNKFKNDYKKLKKNMWIYLKKFIFGDTKVKYKIKALIKYCFYEIILLKHGGKNAKN